jgi:uncharacterized protein (TIGR04255 family)
MATPRRLDSPPISEALVDFRAAFPYPKEDFDALAKEVSAEYPVVKLKSLTRAELKIEAGKLLPPTTMDLGFQGVMLFDAAEARAVQFRPDGFTFNCVKEYIGGDALIAEALRLWTLFTSRMTTSLVTRVAMRYTNQLRLPFQIGDDLQRFLVATPVVPEGSPQQISEYLSRVVAHDDVTTVVTIQRLTPQLDGHPLVVLDIDAFRHGEFSTSPASLQAILEELRLVKNNTFFSLITEDAVNLYVR